MVAIVPFPGAPSANIRNGPRIQHCHDLWSGYVNSGDLYPQGVPNFNIYTQTFWQYIDVFVYFGHQTWQNGTQVDCEFIIPPPWWINAGHRNGVPVLGTIQFETAAEYQDLVANIVTVDNSDQIIDALYNCLKYYGFDGWYFNVEQPPSGAPSNYRSQLLNLVGGLHSRLSNEGFLTIWYNSIGPTGNVAWDPAEVDQNNVSFLNSCDGIFIDYRWKTPGNIATTLATVTSPSEQNNVYFGIRPFKNLVYPPNVTGGNQGQMQSYIPVQACVRKNLSAALFAASWTYQKSNGTPEDYEARDLQLWVGNGGEWPTSGIASIVNMPRQVLNVPFVTSFSTGNGNLFAVAGATVSSNDWGNLSVQDILPTWRFGITGQTPSDAVSVAFSYAAAFEGGSCLAFTSAAGAPGQAEVDLFLTDIPSDGLVVSYSFQGLPQVFLTLYLADGTWFGLSDPSAFPSQPPPLAGTGSGQFVTLASSTVANGWTTRTYNLPGGAAIARISIDLYSTSSPFNTLLGQIILAPNLNPPSGVTSVSSEYVQLATFNGIQLLIATLVYVPNPKTPGTTAYFDIWSGQYPNLTWVGRSYALQYLVAVPVPASSGSMYFVVQTVGVNGQREDLASALSVQVQYSSEN
jgi:hypothetical protein